ncbi:MAG: transporter, partial [Deltaproteobacteria bacterium]
MSLSEKPGRLFAFVYKCPRLILMISLLLSVISVVYTKNNMEFLTGRDDLMPKNAPFQLDYRAYREEFGDQEEIVAVLESDDAGKTTRAADALYLSLNREKTVFREVFYPGGLSFFRKNGLLLLPLEDIRSLRNTMSMAAPVLKDLAAAPSVQTLFTSLTSQIDRYLQSNDPGSLASLTFMLKSLDRGFKDFAPAGSKKSDSAVKSGMSMDSFLKG